MPVSEIVFVDKLPLVAIDPEGVTLIASSGDTTWSRRFSRSMWRRLLEVEIRRLNQWEGIERAERGCILPFGRPA